MYICLNGENYLIPSNVIDRHKEMLFGYLKEGTNVLDISKMISNDKDNFLNIFYHDCVNAVGVCAFSIDDIYLEGYNSLKNELKELDNVLDKLQNRSDKQLFYDKLFDGIEVILEFYNNMLKEEKIEIKGR